MIEQSEIVGLVLSCRVLGNGVEHEFLGALIEQLKPDHAALTGRIVETARNIPVCNIYRGHGFVRQGDGRWQLYLRAEAAPKASITAVA